jgi:primosomal protein N' (replication factor Y)
LTETTTYFAEVIVPVPVAGMFRYRIPGEWAQLVQAGMRVVVNFGRNRVVTGVVHHVHQQPPGKANVKYLLDVLDDEPLVPPQQLKLWEWIANYYLCHIGEAMNGALPSGLKINSQSRLQINPEFELQQQHKPLELSDEEQQLLDALKEHGSLLYDKAAEALDLKNPFTVIKALIAKKAILLFEEVKEKYRPKVLKRIRLADGYAHAPEALQELMQLLARKPKQEEVLLKYLSAVPVLTNVQLNRQGMPKPDLAVGTSASSLSTLIKNGILEEFEQVVSRLDEVALEQKVQQAEGFTLSEAQQQAFAEIKEAFSLQQPVLLHGITGSGKTEVYVELIREALENGTQCLLMVSEIVLTAQMVVRLKKVFGDKLGVYHSRFSDNERVEVYMGVASGRFPVVIGVRSALFLPFDDLGLIVVDEEHESAYKQYEPAPRYHARDSALVLARLHGAQILLGSATPSVESYYLATAGKYTLVSLLTRYGKGGLPKIVTADIRKERQEKTLHNEFTSQLLGAVEQRLEKQEQVILFQSRRGYSPYVTCQECNYIPHCKNCSVSLTFHQYRRELRCHYCGYTEQVPRSCPACGSPDIKTVGMGTERLEEELQLLLPTARVQRMDLDTTRSKYSYQQIISDFEEGVVDVLVGTQMVSKGLDFERVSLVGVFDIDRMINYPDFRSEERSFQLVVQVSGRAGRRETTGEVIIQTSNPTHALIRQLLTQDYNWFYNKEIRERQQFEYPPYTRLIRLTTKHAEREVNTQAAEQLTARLRDKLGKEAVLGPEEPIIERVRGKYLKNILIKINRTDKRLASIKKFIADEVHNFKSEKINNKLQVVIDVDPA